MIRPLFRPAANVIFCSAPLLLLLLLHTARTAEWVMLQSEDCDWMRRICCCPFNGAGVIVRADRIKDKPN